MFKRSVFYTAVFYITLFLSTTVRADDDKIDVQLTGVPDEYSDIILEGLSIVRHGDEHASDKRVKQLDHSATGELKTMLAVYGYYNIEVKGDLHKESEQWYAIYHVTLGEQIKISQVQLNIEGPALEDTAFQSLISDFPLKEGAPFTHENYEAAKKKLVRLGSSRGYFDAELLENKVEVNTDDNSATIYLKWKSGIRYRFDTIVFPDTVINESSFERITPIKGGEYYLAKDVLKLRNNLNDSSYFKSVAVTTLIAERHDGVVPLSIALEPEKKHKYTAGIGFGTDSGVRGSLGWENRYVNKKGHRLKAEAELSGIKQAITADYSIPFGRKHIQEVGFNTVYKHEITDTSESTSYTVGGYYKRKRWGWDEKGSLRLVNEAFVVALDDDTSLLLIPAVVWSKKWADDSTYTRQGGRLSFEVSGASDAVISDISFIQSVVRGKYIQSTTENGRIITRSTVGMTEVSDFSRLPSSLRFFSGGDNTIRGFDYESLGPKDESGDVVGGRYLFIGSVEYEQMLYGDWGAAVFSDFGNAFNDWADPFEYSVGAGLRWRSPVGLVRIDIASGISDPKKPIGLHIVIGPDL